ncbi:MAG TPA: hypothetical protein VEY95_02035 [Azospirillaceae bacterium]|nr:hypothetical protein [Azospirillaceae bacterium]
MTEVELVALVLAGVGPLMAVARVLRLPDSLLLLGAGVAMAYVPGLPPARLAPGLVLALFLPPIIYAATVRLSVHLLRFTFVTGVLTGALLALGTTAAVAVTARLVLPGLPWTSAALIGIVASVFDTRLFHEARGRPHVPRAIADALKAREMASRVVVISGFALAIDALVQGPPSLWSVLGGFAYDIAGGAVVGTIIGWAVDWLRRRIDPAPVEIAVSVATPYLGALAARGLGMSMVVVIMAAALTISTLRISPRTGATGSSSEARITAVAFWEETSLIVSAVLFLLAGRELPDALAGIEAWQVRQVAGASAFVLAVVLAVQYAAALATTAAPSIAPAVDRHPTATRPTAAGVMAWASTRSVVGLLLALSIPTHLPDGTPFAERDLVVVVLALVITGSVLAQGLSLRFFVKHAPLADDAGAEHERRLADHVVADAGGRSDAARRNLLRLRAENRIGDEVLRSMLREVDLRTRAAEGGGLPGAGPPNP